MIIITIVSTNLCRIQDKMPVKKVQISILIEDSKNPDKPDLRNKHGISFFIQAKIGDNDVAVLMDTGPSPETLLYNSAKMGINLEDIDVIVLSHGHYDHTGGLHEILKKIKKRIPVIGHPTVLQPKLSMMPHLRLIGAPVTSSNIESTHGVPVFATDPVTIADGIMTTGEVPRISPFETVKGFWTVQNQRYIEDKMIDDQSLIIDVEGKGLVIITGCAHAGIINTIKYAQKIAKNRKVHAVLGGFHLISASDNRIQATIDELKKLNLEFVGPCHCTGKKAIKKMDEAFGDRCHYLHSGHIIEF